MVNGNECFFGSGYTGRFSEARCCSGLARKLHSPGVPGSDLDWGYCCTWLHWLTLSVLMFASRCRDPEDFTQSDLGNAADLSCTETSDLWDTVGTKVQVRVICVNLEK